jgi:hypothetical protein
MGQEAWPAAWAGGIHFRGHPQSYRNFHGQVSVHR